MTEEIKFLYEDRKVIIPHEILEQMKYLTKSDVTYSGSKQELKSEMSTGLFYDKIERIVRKCVLNIQFLPDSSNEINYDISIMQSLVQRFRKLIPENTSIDYMEYEIRNIDEGKIGSLIEIAYNLSEEVKKYYLMCNLIHAKNDCIENMKYFVNHDIILQWSYEYDQAIKMRDIAKMSEMLDSVQQAILGEWENYFTNMETMTDEHFAFIGHSTSSTKFNGPFYSNFVSASLFTQDLTDTYRAGYGFIFAPKKIIGANSQDMYVNNYVEDEDMMLNYSVIKKIDHPKRIIEECEKLKQKNIQDEKGSKVYNEVVIEDFEPIGIFCFTDGSKSLNDNQIRAQELQKSFPDLKIYSFDVMKRKKGSDLVEMKLQLLNNLQRSFTFHTYDINSDMLSKYDYFFEEFDKLKQSGQYDEIAIETIFKANDQLLSIFDTNPEDLFSGKYSESQIKYILEKNVNYNIEYILSGKAKAFALSKLKVLLPYKDRLHDMFDGLSEFLDLISLVEITDEIMEEINKREPITFYTICQCLTSKIMANIDIQQRQTKESINSFQIKYTELLKEYQKRIKIEEQYKSFKAIDMNKFYVDLIKDDYTHVIKEMESNKAKENQIRLELNKLIKMINELEAKKQKISNSTYENIQTHMEIEGAIEEIKAKLAVLSKHPFINRKIIKEATAKLQYLEKKDSSQKNAFETNKDSETNRLDQEIIELSSRKKNLELDLSYIQSTGKSYEEQLKQINDKIHRYFKCNSVREIDISVARAERFIAQYDLSNSFYLSQIKEQLDRINIMIGEHQQKLELLQAAKSTVSRRM